MGLTIHWKLKFDGSKVDALSLVNQMRSKAMDMSFEEVSEVAHFAGQVCDYELMRGKDNPWFWALIQTQGNVTVKPDGTRLKKNENSSVGTCWISVKPIEAILFRTWPGEGCEEANFGLCRYPKSIAHNGQMIATRLGTGWHWHSFCKTQYANEKGVMNFLRCHTLVVAMLDHAKELEILEEVHDEGDYWEKRDLKALAEEVGRWDAFVAALAGVLKDVVGSADMQLQAPILERPDFEHLEMLGLQHLGNRGLVQLRELFDKVK